jgi:hypothetical protein
MHYFEGDRVYDSVPVWVAAMLSFGYHWCDRSSGARRIALLSMPCESEAAGLVALGAFRRDLELTTTNYIDSYFDLLVRFCRERQTELKYKVPPPELSSPDVRNVLDNSRWRFVADKSSPDKIAIEDAGYRQFIKRGGKLIQNQNGPCLSYITRESALDWQLHNFPLPQIPLVGGEALELPVYSALPFCSGPILDANLCRSYDGLVLVGQGAARDSAYMQKYYAAGFTSGNRQLPLGELLTLHNSEKKYIQRLRFVNERTTDDDGGHNARLVVADGISALLRAEQVYPNSDIIAFCNRDASVEAILQLKGWLNEKMRYYTDADTRHGFLDETPVGTLLRVLRRRV